MRKRGFYAHLAVRSLRLNAKFYIPYICTGAVAAAMLYIMFYLNGSQGVQELRGSQYVQTMLFLGAGVVAIFSAILLFYADSFLMKRRQKELGLFNILGMEKRHIARMMLWETLYCAVLSIIGGLLLGLLLSKLLLALLCQIMYCPVPFGFEISAPGLLWTAIVFAVIFVLNFLFDLRRVGKAKPVELLYAGNVAERDPSSKWPLTVIGLLTLGAGYVMALSVKSPLAALGLFFVAVLLVIAGTYCLFISGSIVVLKALRRNRGYYYQERHFIAVSGMLHRMKRNAAGLASICILSTMALVTISTTVCLYTGTEEVLDMLYPRDIHIMIIESDEESMEILQAKVQEQADKLGVEISDPAVALFYTDENDLGSSQFIGEKLRLYEEQGGVVGEAGQDYPPNAFVGFNTADGEISPELNAAIWDSLESSGLVYERALIENRAERAVEIDGITGGFFFLGVFLGSLFLLATALIIYYKQLSEGYEDAGRFKIMRQVGLSEKGLRASLHSQIKTVFFLPLIAAALHIAFAFNMMTRLLAIFSLYNTMLFALCCVAALAVFAALYAAIYALTARSYYHIVNA